MGISAARRERTDVLSGRIPISSPSHCGRLPGRPCRAEAAGDRAEDRKAGVTLTAGEIDRSPSFRQDGLSNSADLRFEVHEGRELMKRLEMLNRSTIYNCDPPPTDAYENMR